MPKRDDAHMAARRRQILDAAREAIDRDGIDALSMTSIATTAGLSIGAIYTHFRSKQELLTELIGSDPHARPLFDDCTTPGQTLARFEEMLEQFGRRDDRNIRQRIVFEITTLARNNPEVRAAVEAGYQGQRAATLRQAAMLAHPGLDPERVAVLGECLFALLLSAQMQMVAGVSADAAAKARAVRSLLEELHGGPFRKAPRRR